MPLAYIDERAAFREIATSLSSRLAEDSDLPVGSAPGGVEIDESFDHDGLVANSFSHNSEGASTPRSSRWIVTSGSLFARDGLGTNGAIDSGTPNAMSSTWTGSAVFRLRSRRALVGDMVLQAAYRVEALVSTARTPPHPWDGLHLWQRYRNQDELYVATVHRRDSVVVIKRKCPVDGGTYFTLASSTGDSDQRWHTADFRAHDLSNGSVYLTLRIDGAVRISARDSGAENCEPIQRWGSVGVRADNALIYLDRVTAGTAPRSTRVLLENG